MEVVTAKIAIDPQDLRQAEEIFADLGMDISTAVSIFFRQTIRENGFPFVITRNVPNAETMAAMMECEEIIAHPERFKGFSTADELLEDIFADSYLYN